MNNQKSGRNQVKFGFKQKMLFSLLPIIIIVFLSLTFIIYTSNKKILHENAVQELTHMAYRYANDMNRELMEQMTVARDYNLLLSNANTVDINVRREYCDNLTGMFLKNNPNILAVWADFYENTFDGRDAQYIGKYPPKGRYRLGWNRGSGNPERDANLFLSEETGEEEYYIRPKQERNEVLLSPYYYSYTEGGKEILETTMCMPIFNSKDEIIGISGIDVSLESIKTSLDVIKPLKTGYVSLISYEGMFVSFPDVTMLGKYITDNSAYKNNPNILNDIKAGKEFILETYSTINNEKSLEIFVPVKIGTTTTPLSLSISVPYSTIFADNEAMFRMLIIICTIALIIIAIVVFITASKLSKPLIKLSEEAEKLAQGDLNINIVTKSNDETGILSNTVYHVADVLNMLLKDINNMIRAASDGKLDIRVNAQKYNGSYQNLISGVNTLLDNITAPINITAEYLNRISIGDIPSPITDKFNGSFDDIKNSLNGCINAVGLLISDTNYLVNKALDGNLKSRANAEKHSGNYRQIIEGVNGLLDAVAAPIQATASFLEMVATGNQNISQIEEEYRGEFNEIKKNINTTYNTIVHFSAELKKLLSAAQSGHLEVRADINSLQGNWREMGVGVNAIFAMFSDLIVDSGTVLAAMATGDLTARMANEYNGQFKEVKDNINHLGSSLDSLISHLISIVYTTASAAEQISSSAESLASATQEQSSQTEDVAAAVSQMSNTAVSNAESATLTSNLAQKSGNIANNGSKVVTQTIQKMREIANVVHNSALSIEHLGKSSREIGEIVEVINDIADQTNLLALNAAIEAARAGEQGRGFAVVADEVRKLSERTADATKQIADMITSIQNETSLAVEAMEKGTIEVKSGIDLADRAGNSLTEILTSTNELLHMINSIAIANEEQSVTSEKIAYNVNSISHVTNESAKNIEDVATTASELAKLTDDLNQMVNRFTVSHNNNPNMDLTTNRNDNYLLPQTNEN